MRSSRMPGPRYSMTHIIIKFLWIEMLVRGELGGTTLAAALTGRRPRRWVLTRAIEYILIWTSQKLCCNQAKAPAHVEHQTLQAAAAGGTSALPSANQVDSNPFNALDRLIAASCRIHVQHKFKFFLPRPWAIAPQ